MKGINELSKEKLFEEFIATGNYFGSIMTEGNKAAPVTLISFPYETQGRERDPIYRREGASYYPDSLRRFLGLIGTLSNPLISPELEKKFKKLEVSDLGDSVYVDRGQRKKFKLSKNTVSLEENLQALEEKILDLEASRKGNSLPSTTIGLNSSREAIFAYLRAYFFEGETGKFEISKKLKLIIVSNTLDLRGFYQGGNIHAGSYIRKFIQSFPQVLGHLEITYYGVVRELTHDEELSFLEENRDIITKVIFTDEVSNANNTLDSLLEATKGDQIGIAVNLEALKISQFSGVGRISALSCVDRMQLTSFLKKSGENGNCRFLNFSDHNPLVEDYITGKKLALLIYNYCMTFSANL